MDIESLLKAVTGLISLIGVVVLGIKVKRSGRDSERLKQQEEANEQDKKADDARRNYYTGDAYERRRRMLDAARKDSND